LFTRRLRTTHYGGTKTTYLQSVHSRDFVVSVDGTVAQTQMKHRRSDFVVK